MDEADLEAEREDTSPLARAIIGRGHEQEPLRHYLMLMTSFTSATVLGYAILRRSRRELPKPSVRDVAILGLATNRLSRLLTRDKVTRPVRAPFTEVVPGSDPNTVRERARGHGAVRAVGELLTCPRCAAVWSAGALGFAYALAPSFARFVAGMLASAAISDYVNRRYAALPEPLRAPAV